MDDSDEERVLLEDESMDEMHEIESNLAASVDTNASPAKQSRHKPRFGDQDEDGDNDSDMSEMFGASSSDGEAESNHWRAAPPLRLNDVPNPTPVHERDGDEEDDEPPEIPGSLQRAANDEFADTNYMAHTSTSRDISRENHRSVEILQLHTTSDDEAVDVDREDYETKEEEAPRAMEFHTSSSESESEGSDYDNGHFRVNQPRISSQQSQERPKTAAKVLEQYRDVLPSDLYEQIIHDAPVSPAKQASKSQAEKAARDSTTQHPTLGKSTVALSHKVRVPKEIQELFKLADEFSPELIDIPIQLHPFIPEYVPIVGLPFDGIQIPRPDGKRDPSGVAFMREPCAQSNVAELELLLSVEAKKRQHRRANEMEHVHSISDASHRPREIDQWIASVNKVQASKSPPQVHYKKPMPSETSLMELWPEAFEAFLVTQEPLLLSKLDVNLPELIRIVCGVLDIPVYDGLYVHSLHALFSLYNEVIAYEKEVLGKRGDSR